MTISARSIQWAREHHDQAAELRKLAKRQDPKPALSQVMEQLESALSTMDDLSNGSTGHREASRYANIGRRIQIAIADMNDLQTAEPLGWDELDNVVIVP